MRTGFAAPDGESVEQPSGQRCNAAALEKEIARRKWEDVVAPGQGERSPQDQGVQMTGVVGRHHEGRTRGKVLTAVDLVAMQQAKGDAHGTPDQKPGDAFDQTA